jgi:hypothetical protein
VVKKSNHRHLSVRVDALVGVVDESLDRRVTVHLVGRLAFRTEASGQQGWGLWC